jgi:hypothetical protein
MRLRACAREEIRYVDLSMMGREMLQRTACVVLRASKSELADSLTDSPAAAEFECRRSQKEQCTMSLYI